MISYGLNFLYKVLQRQNHEERVELIADNLAISSNSIIHVIDFADPATNGYFFLSPADEKYETEDIEKTLPLMPLIEQPSQGWRTRWFAKDEKIDDVIPEEMYEEYSVADLYDCRWGYALWDGEKLEQWQAPILAKQRELTPDTEDSENQPE